MRVWFGIVTALLTVAACTQEAAVENPPKDDCDAAAFQYLKWQKAEVLDDLPLPNPHRIIPSGGAVTMDYRPERLNFSIGETGRIETIRCG